jgi:hypothetical protein
MMALQNAPKSEALHGFPDLAVAILPRTNSIQRNPNVVGLQTTTSHLMNWTVSNDSISSGSGYPLFDEDVRELCFSLALRDRGCFTSAPKGPGWKVIDELVHMTSQ